MQEQFDNLRKGRSRVLVKKHTLVIGYQREKVISIIQVRVFPEYHGMLPIYRLYDLTTLCLLRIPYLQFQELRDYCKLRGIRSHLVILSSIPKETVESEIIE